MHQRPDAGGYIKLFCENIPGWRQAMEAYRARGLVTQAQIDNNECPDFYTAVSAEDIWSSWEGGAYMPYPALDIGKSPTGCTLYIAART